MSELKKDGIRAVMSESVERDTLKSMAQRVSADKDKAREIVKHISDAALELAFIRHNLTSDEIDADEDTSVKERVAATEEFVERVKEDTLNCLTGDDTGCLDPEELDESNCELLWTKAALATVRKEILREAILIVDTAPLCHSVGKQYIDPVALVQRMNDALERAADSREGENDG